MKILSIILLIFSVLWGADSDAIAQIDQNFEELKNCNYEFYESQIQNPELKAHQIENFARLWLRKAKDQNNDNEIYKAYKALMYRDSKEYLMMYADSLIGTAKKLKNNDLIGSSFLTKGIICYNRKELQKALDNFVTADKFISQTSNQDNIYKLKYAIAQAKYYLGYYQDAVALLNQCELYFSIENDRAYLSTLHSLALCYTKLKEYKKSSYYNQIGIQECKELENKDMPFYFRHAEAINQHYLKNYNKSINELKIIIPYLRKFNDDPNLTLANFYIGKSYWKLNQKERAIVFLMKVDQAYDKTDYIKPELRENYEMLLHHFENTDQELFVKYMKKLIIIDKVLAEKYAYLSTKINKEYDTQKLLRIQERMNDENDRVYILLAITTLIIGFLIFRHFANKRRYLKKFQQLMNVDCELTRNSSNKEVNFDTIDINQDLVKMVLDNLEKFEKTKTFLENDMNLTRIAGYLKTNGKYASKIILRTRGKKTVTYINDLKIEHIIQLLKKDTKFRNYTYVALSEEAGFGSTQQFIRAFKNYTDLTPLYFIEQLNITDEEIKKHI